VAIETAEHAVACHAEAVRDGGRVDRDEDAGLAAGAVEMLEVIVVPLVDRPQEVEIGSRFGA
jgi:hypothetical protein